MIEPRVINLDRIPDTLLSSLENRDVALWVRNLSEASYIQDSLTDFLGLPWRLVLCEDYIPDVVDALESTVHSDDPMIQKRGFIQIIDSDPSHVELPQRCLPIYLLNGRQTSHVTTDFISSLRRMTMLDSLRRSGVRNLLIITDDEDPVPSGLEELWSSGFRTYLTFVSNQEGSQTLEEWPASTHGINAANLLCLPTRQVIEDILARYKVTYPEERRMVRIRDASRNYQRIDLTQADDPERPILEFYSLIEERDLTPIMPDGLSEEDFIGFFQSPYNSWRPYAAGLPWIRDSISKDKLINILSELDSTGSDANCIAYIPSESGAGGTTFVRMLGWECARLGYPVLVAKPLSFTPNALAVANFLNQVHHIVDSVIVRESLSATTPAYETQKEHAKEPRRYVTPWVIIFDSLHWQSRYGELTRFFNELMKSGRPVCILIVTESSLDPSVHNTSKFNQLTELNHILNKDEARELGSHFNQFLRVYDKERSELQWDRFYQNHTVPHLGGISTFWVTLSFWIQGQYDLSESIQEWMFRCFKENATNQGLQSAILEIAALSSERLPLPEVLLSESEDEWPLSYQLDDNKSSLSALGLVVISVNGERHWTLVHDILGRFLLNALFYDHSMREKLGFADAANTEHLRFLILSHISQKSMLGERTNRSIGEEFATSIFKIDPDHGRGSFASFWREVLKALDGMPQTLRNTSRSFRHHTAVSRRRIAKLDERLYGVTDDDKILLLQKAIEDIDYALKSIQYTEGSDSDLNLYNSLANAYLDLAEVKTSIGASLEHIRKLRQLASDVTYKAYAENPTSPFVIETYVKNLLDESSERIIEHCLEALGILYSALSSDENDYRRPNISDLADQALSILFKQRPVVTEDTEPSTAIDVLIKAWRILFADSESRLAMTLSDISESKRNQALKILDHPSGRGNMQVIRLSYDLVCVQKPSAFTQQLEFVEQLQATDYKMTPQLRLEYAILLFQAGHAEMGNNEFRHLRRLWRESEYFVYVPERLRWLRELDGDRPKIVHAFTESSHDYKSQARVQEFANIPVPFRPQEFSIRNDRPGMRLTCRVSFGHNGPFLRPVTVHIHG